MIFQISCTIAADGYIEPEIAAKLAPELRPLLLESKTAHSWRWLFPLQADDEVAAWKFFSETFKAKIGDLAVFYTDESISER